MVTTASQLKSSLLKVPGAKIYYEVQGSGPVLLMIPGGPTDAGIFAPLAALLADKYTVVRYDPRGNSRSVLDGPPEDQNMEVHGDDAARLLKSLGNESAFVLGSSGGAQIGLNLAARYPQHVKTLIAHEPPCVRLLPGEGTKFIDDVYATYLAQGTGAAMQKFMAGAGLDGPRMERAAPPSPEAMASFARIQGNLEFFIAHGLKPISRYAPDIEALLSIPTKVVVGAGEASAGTLPYRTAVMLAKCLDAVPEIFPGGHGGYNDDPAGFAEKLHQVFRDA
jgi:pimeloyl-ACP methyl ester carboxylesterase